LNKFFGKQAFLAVFKNSVNILKCTVSSANFVFKLNSYSFVDTGENWCTLSLKNCNKINASPSVPYVGVSNFFLGGGGPVSYTYTL